MTQQTTSDPAGTLSNRRDLLRGALRAVAAGTLVAVSAVLLRRSARPADGGCTRHNLCQGCASADACLLPAARAARKVSGKA